MDWAAKRDWALEEHERRLATPAAEGEREDLRLAGIAGASWAAGLSALMLGEHDEAASLLRRAADEYATSWHAAPPGAWGRPIAMLRCRLIAGDPAGAERDAEAALAAGAMEAAGPIGGYCAALVSSDEPAFELARRDVLGSFEERDAFLEDVAVADTVLVLDALARRRGLEVRPLGSALLPG